MDILFTDLNSLIRTWCSESSLDALQQLKNKRRSIFGQLHLFIIKIIYYHLFIY